jgi:hypothetical protein
LKLDKKGLAKRFVIIEVIDSFNRNLGYNFYNQYLFFGAILIYL